MTMIYLKTGDWTMVEIPQGSGYDDQLIHPFGPTFQLGVGEAPPVPCRQISLGQLKVTLQCDPDEL